jgi:hypothetical protein
MGVDEAHDILRVGSISAAKYALAARRTSLTRRSSAFSRLSRRFSSIMSVVGRSRTQVYLIGARHPVDWTLASRDRLPALCPRLGFVRDFAIDGPLVLIHHPKQLDGRPRNAELCGNGRQSAIEYG